MKPVILAISAAGLLGACQGNKSADPPVHLVLNMDFQQHYRPQAKNDWFHDNRASRTPPEGVLARNDEIVGFQARETKPEVDVRANDPAFYTGRDESGRLIDDLPESVPLTEALLERGQERYAIYCTPCHDNAGTGDGIVIQRGFAVSPPSFHESRLQSMPLGHFYDVITHGQNTMAPYADQLSPDDRWAVSAWLRVLQVSQRATEQDIPASERQNIQRGTP